MADDIFRRLRRMAGKFKQSDGEDLIEERILDELLIAKEKGSSATWVEDTEDERDPVDPFPSDANSWVGYVDHKEEEYLTDPKDRHPEAEAGKDSVTDVVDREEPRKKSKD